MRADLGSTSGRFGVTGRAALIALAIHVAIITALLRSTFTHTFDDVSDRSGSPGSDAANGSVNRKPIFHSHTLFVVNDTGAPVDSARVKDLIADRMLVTPRTGTVTFIKRDGDIFMVRITRSGYAPMRVRLPNDVSEAKAIVIRLKEVPPVR